ncbi:hypothetical protein [Brumimicrobium mesophilum]|uniref:hypothetical protein n=1 Tax=Brumimicrobium mesophilum TaxID=392717 RepID=UPI000D144503|nr:hypothetical protein [Brumimicrobium mesophilum]
MASAERAAEKREKIKLILKDINSGEDTKIIEGLKALKVNGDDNVILPIVDAWNKGVSPETEEEIITFIGDIKSTSSAQTIMDILLNDEYNDIHLPLLSTIWNSKVDYSEYIVDFVSLAVQYDFLVALECLTIIENMEGPFEEHHILDSEIILREFAENHQENETQEEKKVQMILEISKLVKEFDDKIM